MLSQPFREYTFFYNHEWSKYAYSSGGCCCYCHDPMLFLVVAVELATIVLKQIGFKEHIIVSSRTVGKYCCAHII